MPPKTIAGITGELIETEHGAVLVVPDRGRPFGSGFGVARRYAAGAQEELEVIGSITPGSRCGHWWVGMVDAPMGPFPSIAAATRAVAARIAKLDGKGWK